MSTKDEILIEFPDAICVFDKDCDEYNIIEAADLPAAIIGTGDTEEEAWEDVFQTIELNPEDEEFEDEDDIEDEEV